jgi:hypothetical protein
VGGVGLGVGHAKLLSPNMRCGFFCKAGRPRATVKRLENGE